MITKKHLIELIVFMYFFIVLVIGVLFRSIFMLKVGGSLKTSRGSARGVCYQKTVLLNPYCLK